MVDGIGGAFIFSNQPSRLADWYREYLGIEFESDEAGNTFWKVYVSHHPQLPEQKLDQTFAIMKSKVVLPKRPRQAKPASMYGDQPFMINLRVDDLEALLNTLLAKGSEILGQEDLEYGRFAWLYDLDGNRLELYQPATV